MSRSGSIQRAIDDPRVRRGLSTINQTLFDRGIRHGMLLESLKQTEVNAVVRYLNNEVIPDVSKILDKRLGRIVRLGADTGPWTTQYYRDMMNETLGTIRGGMEFTSKRITEQLTKIGYAEAEFARDSLKDSIPFNFDARVPSLQSVRAIVRDVPVEGKLLPRWFKELGDSTQAQIVQQVNLGLVNGEPTAKIIRRITGTKAANYTNGVFGTTKRNAETLVRTHVTHVSNKARELTYEENTDVIKGVQYVATLDARTTDICAGLDGQVFKPTEGPRPPLHMNCRSTTVPITKSWDELGKEMKTDAFSKLKEPKTENQLRASMNGAVPAKTTYNAWLKQQTPEFQNAVLGRRRAQVFRNDRLHLSRFVNYGTFPPKSLTVAELIAYEKSVISGTASGGVGGISGRLGTRGKAGAKKKRTVTKKKTVTKKVTPEPTPPAPAPTPQPTPASTKPTSQMTGTELRAEVERRHGDRIRELRSLEQREKEVSSRWNASQDRVSQLRDQAMASLDETTLPTWKPLNDMDSIVSQELKAVQADPTRPKENLALLERRLTELRQDHFRQKYYAWQTATEEGQALAEIGQEVAVLRTQIRDLVESLRQDIHEMLYLDKAQQGSALTAKGVRFKAGEKFTESWTEAKTWLEKVIHRDTADDAARAVKVSKKKAGYRANCELDGTLNMAADNSARVWVHEFVHRIEDFSEAHLASSRAFRNARVRVAQARGEKLESLRKITGNRAFRADEVAWKDDFISPYMGKEYVFTNKSTATRALFPEKYHRSFAPGETRVIANEIATMSVDRMFTDPVTLLTGDGEMFEFAVDFMRSSGKFFSRKYTDDLLTNPSVNGRLLD
jgi:SPP1 gp7 family putative phage head morphogenesis protein